MEGEDVVPILRTHETSDTEKFILEIQSRPALWDLTSNDYANRDLKKKNWEELVTIFMDKEDASDREKNDYGK